MNKNDSDGELNFIPRWLAPHLGRAVAEHPVVVLTGARQVGKSTLLRHTEPTKRWKYVTLDDLDALRQGERDPAGLWAGEDRVILDEVQRLPAFARNRTTRLIKAPKLHWIDPALAAHLGGLHDEASIRASREPSRRSFASAIGAP